MDTRDLAKLCGRLVVIGLFAACGGTAFESTGRTDSGGTSGAGTGGKASDGSSTGGTSGTSGGSGGKGGAIGSGGSGGTGGRGGTGGISGSTGFGGIGGSGGLAGTAGTGGTLGTGGIAGTCSDPDGPDPTVRATTVGANGTFTDSCDTNGNLIEYTCEMICNCCPNPDPSCFVQTGNVVPQTFDCVGTCVEGACVSRCPHDGDALQFSSGDPSGNAQIKNLSDGSSYSCKLIFDATGGYNCTSATAGLTATIVSLGISSFCPVGSTGNIGIAPQGYTDEQCAYQCTFM